MATRACIYSRTARDTDSDAIDPDGNAIRQQQEQCRQLIERNGWELVTTYADRGMSAARTSPARPGYEAMLTDIEANNVDAVIAHDLHCLHRSTTELEAFVRLLRSSNVKLATVKRGPLNLSHQAGQRAVQDILQAMHEMETRRLRRSRS